MSHFLHRRPENIGPFLHALAKAAGDYDSAYQFAMQDPAAALSRAALVSAKAVAASNGSWAQELGALGVVSREFLNPIVEASILGRIGRAIPARTRVFTPGSGAVSAWIGAGQAVPASELSLDVEVIEPHRLEALLVAENSFLEHTATADVQNYLTSGLTAELLRTLNAAAWDVNNGGISGIKPRSLTYDAPATAATGNFSNDAGITALRSDIRRLFDLFTGSWDNAVLVCNTRTACSLAMSQVLFGVQDHIPIITGSIPGDAASTEGDLLIIADRDAIRFASPDLEIEASRHGNLVLAGSGPSSVTPTPQSSISLFQAGATALKASIVTGWAIPPEGSVAVLSGIPRE
jgi:hypothetical protein